MDGPIGHYGPKLAAQLFGGEPNMMVLFAQHLVIGWASALPLLVLLVRFRGLAAPAAIGAVYGAAYYVIVNSLALPLLFGDPTPWQLEFDVIYPSLLAHVIFGLCIGLTARGFVANESKQVQPFH